MKRNILIYGSAVLLFVCGSGCSRDILDPTQVGRFRPTPVVNVILPSLGVADEPEPMFAGAEDPRPEDIMAYEQDYVLGSGDVVRISIYELLSEGTPYVNDYIVTETGRVSLPEIGMVQAAGLSEVKLEEEINISSTYYLVSRIIYSKICAETGVQMDYFDDHHRYAAGLPFSGEFGPVRLICLRKKGCVPPDQGV